MCRIPHTVRIKGRYVFRRRVHFRNIISKPLSLALQTADPKVARTRAAILSARFAIIRASVDKILGYERTLSGAEIEAIFRQKLDAELQFYLTSAYEDAPWSSSVLEVAREYGEAYKFLRHPDNRYGMNDEARESFVKRGLEGSIPSIEGYVERIKNTLDTGDIIKILETMGIEADESNVAAARMHLIRAGASACTRVQRLFDDDILEAADPFVALTADLGIPTDEVSALIKKIRGHPSPTTVIPDPASMPPQDCQFAIYENRRFSEIIEETLATLKRKKVWKGDLKQQRRIMQAFAWITGDRELGSYDHRDVSTFADGLLCLPTTFRFGTPAEGAMSRPFDEVVSELMPVEPDKQRNLKTVNRDLSTMSTVAKHLALTAWKSKVPNATVMEFAKATVPINEDDSLELRPAWTAAHLECLFRSPIYVGGGRGKRRLKGGEPHPHIWHDAAYFAPLIWYYSHACREEVCGLEVADVSTDHAVPHFEIRDNLTRGRDGEKAGEKRKARRRKLPIHPELIRLGFLDYVRAVRNEGHQALFPELYLFDAKRGGAQFYARAWVYMLEWIGDRMALPIGDTGKGPDIHSIRSLGSSFYERDGVNEIMRADVMGHARQGTNAKHYSKRIKTEGLTVVLTERLQFIERYVPEITGHLDPAPIRLLPIDERSRVGSGRHRRLRSDAGKTKKHE